MEADSRAGNFNDEEGISTQPRCLRIGRATDLTRERFVVQCRVGHDASQVAHDYGSRLQATRPAREHERLAAASQ